MTKSKILMDDWNAILPESPSWTSIFSDPVSLLTWELLAVRIL